MDILFILKKIIVPFLLNKNKNVFEYFLIDIRTYVLYNVRKLMSTVQKVECTESGAVYDKRGYSQVSG